MKSKRVGYLGETEATRLVEDFEADCKLRNRVAVLCGLSITFLVLWSEAVLFYSIAG